MAQSFRDFGYWNRHPTSFSGNQSQYKQIREGDDDPKVDLDWYRFNPMIAQAAQESGQYWGIPNTLTQGDYRFGSGSIESKGDIDRAVAWLSAGRPTPRQAPAPVAAPVVAPTPAPSLAPTKLDVSSAPAPTPGPSTSTTTTTTPSVFGSGTGAYQSQGVKSAALNPRRERMKLSSFNRGRRPLSLQSVNI